MFDFLQFPKFHTLCPLLFTLASLQKKKKKQPKNENKTLKSHQGEVISLSEH